MDTSSVTIRDVARRAGVSISSVSRVINNNAPVSSGIRERVLRVIEEIGYTPDKSAQVLKRQKTGVIGIVIPDISNPFFSLMARGTENAARSHGYSVLICDTNNQLKIENGYIDILLYERVEGVILTSTERVNENIYKLLRRHIPVVAADRRLEEPNVTTVASNGIQDCQILTRYLIKLGYRNIVFLAGPEHVSTAQDRLEGFHMTMKEHRLSAKVVKSQASDYSFESGYTAAHQLRTGPLPEAIIAANDLMAVGALSALEELGLKIPEHIGVAGFDHIPLTEWIKPRLTTVDIPAYDIGRRAMDLLAQVIQTGELPQNQTVVTSRLIEGESTRKVR